jgi:hypothetical protein
MTPPAHQPGLADNLLLNITLVNPSLTLFLMKLPLSQTTFLTMEFYTKTKPSKHLTSNFTPESNLTEISFYTTTKTLPQVTPFGLPTHTVKVMVLSI